MNGINKRLYQISLRQGLLRTSQEVDRPRPVNSSYLHSLTQRQILELLDDPTLTSKDFVAITRVISRSPFTEAKKKIINHPKLLSYPSRLKQIHRFLHLPKEQEVADLIINKYKSLDRNKIEQELKSIQKTHEKASFTKDMDSTIGVINRIIRGFRAKKDINSLRAILKIVSEFDQKTE